MERLPLFHVVRFDSLPIHSRELQSVEIRSLTLKSSAKGIHPEFEYRAQNRVHVETASISLRQPLSALPEGGI